jgi:hypothetical protein
MCFMPPCERTLLGVEKPIDDERITLDRLPSTQPRSFSIDYSLFRPGVAIWPLVSSQNGFAHPAALEFCGSEQNFLSRCPEKAWRVDEPLNK